MSTCAMDEYLGAYVIRALQRHEEVAVEAHLATCPACAEEADSLVATVSHLALLTPADVEELLGLGSAGLRARPVRPARPVRRRAVLAGAAAAVVAVVAAATGVAVSGIGAAPPPQTVRASDPGTAVQAALTITDRRFGTRLHLSLRGAYPRGECYLVVRARDGRTEVAARWSATPSGVAEVDATTSVPRGELDEFDVVTPSGRRLVRLVMPSRPH